MLPIEKLVTLLPYRSEDLFEIVRCYFQVKRNEHGYVDAANDSWAFNLDNKESLLEMVRVLSPQRVRRLFDSNDRFFYFETLHSSPVPFCGRETFPDSVWEDIVKTIIDKPGSFPWVGQLFWDAVEDNDINVALKDLLGAGEKETIDVELLAGGDDYSLYSVETSKGVVVNVLKVEENFYLTDEETVCLGRMKEIEWVLMKKSKEGFWFRTSKGIFLGKDFKEFNPFFYEAEREFFYKLKTKISPERFFVTKFENNMIVFKCEDDRTYLFCSTSEGDEPEIFVRRHEPVVLD